MAKLAGCKMVSFHKKPGRGGCWALFRSGILFIVPVQVARNCFFGAQLLLLAFQRQQL